MKTKNCSWCNQEIQIGWGQKRNTSRFCNDECRMKYHNELKREKHQSALVLAEIRRMQNNALRSGDLGDFAQRHLNVIQQEFVLKENYFPCCKACGQSAFIWPEHGEKCPFCGQTDWVFKIKTGEQS